MWERLQEHPPVVPITLSCIRAILREKGSIDNVFRVEDQVQSAFTLQWLIHSFPFP